MLTAPGTPDSPPAFFTKEDGAFYVCEHCGAKTKVIEKVNGLFACEIHKA